MTTNPILPEEESAGFFREKSTTDTYSIISTVAFLIGVPQQIFENEHEPPEQDVYDKLKYNKNA